MLNNIFSQIFTIGIALIFVFVIAYAIDLIISRIHKKAVFVLPVFFFVVSVILWGLGLLASDDGNWAAFGLLIYGTFSVIACVGSLLAGLVWWYRMKKKPT